MSLIMAYIGRYGCVMIGDKRRIAFFGDKDKREKLEEELYSGAIKTEEELLNKAKSLEITLNITDDAEKVRNIKDVVVGEVKFRTPFETKRKRIYGMTNGYIIVELLGSNIEKMQKGDSSVVVFGNKITKKMAQDALNKQLKSPLSLEKIANIFKAIMDDISQKTPSVSQESNVFIKHSDTDKKHAQKILRETIVKDIRELQEWREGLRKKLENTAKTIEIASKIIDSGEIGRVIKVNEEKVEIMLNKSTQAMNIEWEVTAEPGDVITMCLDEPSDITVGDQAVIENENLCIKRTKSPLKCDVILCKAG